MAVILSPYNNLPTNAEAAAISYRTYLYVRTAEPSGGDPGMSRLCDIKTTPAEEAPEDVEATTLSDGTRTYVPGLQSNGNMEFTTNFNADTYNKINGMDGVYHWSISTQSPTPGDVLGNWAFDGRIRVTRSEWTVGAVREMTLHLYPTSAITFSTSTVPSSSG